MSMTEIVSFLDMAVYPSIALIFFLAAFVAITWRVMTRPKQELIDASRIVLDDDEIVTPRTPSLCDTTHTKPGADKGANHG